MERLETMKYVASREGEPTVTAAEIAAYQPQVAAWRIIERDNMKQLERVFKFPNFVLALAFTNKVGELAEAAGHHPAILTEWGKVTITWSTHTIKGLHRNDFIMAAKCDALYSPG